MVERAWTTRLVLVTSCLLLAGSLLAAMVRAAPEGRVGGHDGSADHALHVLPPGVLLQDDFEDDPVGARVPSGWMVADGVWDGVVVDRSKVLRHGRGRSYGHLVAGSPAWTDVSVSADVKATPLAVGFAGVAARYRSSGDYYECVIHDAYALQLWRLRGDVGKQLDGRRVPIDTTRFHSVRLVVRGSRLACALDGVPLLAFVDASFGSGGIALVASDDEAAEFDNVRVTIPS